MVCWSIPAPYDCHVDDDEDVGGGDASSVATDVESDDEDDENDENSAHAVDDVGARRVGRKGEATA
jgi:hypothetical protein